MPRTTSNPSDEAPGCNIHRLRVEFGYSMRRLAQLCDPELDHTTIRRLERNEGYTQESLERVAKVLHVTVQELFLPPDLNGWPSLSPRARERITHAIQDAVTAQRYNSTG